MPTDDPTARALLLLALLQSRREWPLPALAERLDTSTRTVRRDVRRLRDLGYAVAGSPGPGAAYRLEAGARIPPLLFDEDELLVLAAGLRMAQHRFAGDAAERALGKLVRVLPPSAAERFREATETTEVGEHADGATALDTGTVDLLTRAAVAGTAVGFGFVDRFGRATTRRVLPYRQVASRGRWYLVAHDLDRVDWRAFRLDRVTEVEELPGHFDRPALPAASVAEYFATDFGRL